MWQYWRGIFAPHASFFFDRIADRMWSLSGAGGNSYRSPPGPALFLRAALWSHVCTRKMASCDGSRCEIVALWQPLDGSPPIFIPSAFHFYYNFFLLLLLTPFAFFPHQKSQLFLHISGRSAEIFPARNASHRKIKFKDFLFFQTTNLSTWNQLNGQHYSKHVARIVWIWMGFIDHWAAKGKGSVATLRLRKKFIGFWLLLSLMSIANRFRILDALGGKFEYSNDWENVLKEPGIKFK